MKMNKWITAIILGLLSFNAHAFEAGEILVNKQWTAEVVESHFAWDQAACVAYTKTQDGLSTLEVTSLYNEETDTFSEPTVNILTPLDVVFFEVSVSIDRIADAFVFLPILPNADNSQMAGARALVDDRSTLVEALEDRNVVTAKYFDALGEVKSLTFSLSGSGATIRQQFAECELNILEREALEPLALP